ncbi:hypothetical protein ACWGBV_06725 [Streptomyces sp. NPDC055051]|uniref:hypothetical protein n=1 Tax=Streptomyces sp. NPDC014861 TaxID=3364923 RepID=UPI0037033EBA
MRANRKLWAATTICLTAVIGLTGCGKGDDKAADPFAGVSADDIAKKAIEATKTATSVHMKGDIKSDGQAMAIDFSVDDKGTCQGTMGVGAEGKAEIMRTGGFTYIKGDDAFYKNSGDEKGASAEEGAAMAALLNGRWMKMPAEGSDSDDMGEFCDLKALFADMGKDDKTTGLTREADADVDGTPAVVLKSKADDKGEVNTVYVAKDSAKPYILRTVATGGEEPGEMTLSDYDKALTVTPPPADQVMDLEALMKAGAGS